MSDVLGYWDIRGIAESIRYLIAHVGANIQDKRFPIGPAPDFDRSLWLEEKAKLDLSFPNPPYYIETGTSIKLSGLIPIIRHLARKHDIGAPAGDLNLNARLDQAETQALELTMNLVKLCHSPSATYEKLKADYLKTLGEQLKLLSKYIGSGPYVLNDRLTYVDFMLYEALDQHKCFEVGCLEATPNLIEYIKRIEALPSMQTYLGSHSRYPIFSAMAKWGTTPPS